MKFSPTKLEATVDYIAEGKSSPIGKFSLGSDFVEYHSCFSPGHKHCFNDDLETSNYYCVRSQCTRMQNQNKICSVVRRGQKRQAEKMLSDTAKSLPLVSIGENEILSHQSI